MVVLFFTFLTYTPPIYVPLNMKYNIYFQHSTEIRESETNFK